MLGTKKIKAFTIAEILVVLVLTSIVVSIALVVLNLIQKQITGIQTQMKRQNNIQVLEKVLWQDLNRNKLYYFRNKKTLKCINPLDSIIYSFDNNFILRNQDTIKIAVKNKYLYLDGEIVYSGAFDAIELELSEKYQNRTLFVFQKKDATFYINKN
jgi:competence protein ComGF